MKSDAKKGNATIISTLRLISLFVNWDNNGCLPVIWDLLFVPDRQQEVLEAVEQFMQAIFEELGWNIVITRGFVGLQLGFCLHDFFGTRWIGISLCKGLTADVEGGCVRCWSI